jgi:magnesium transporter
MKRNRKSPSHKTPGLAPVKPSHKAGSPPGTLLHIGERRLETPRLIWTEYTADSFGEHQLELAQACPMLKPAPTITWLNVDGLHDVEMMQQIGECFHLHPLVLEDIVNTSQRPKLEDTADYLYIALRALNIDQTGNIRSDQISLVVGPNFVVSFQEGGADNFSEVRQRLANCRSRIRTAGADYLAYSLMDAVIDEYFGVVEAIGEQIDLLQDRLLENPREDALKGIHQMKREMIVVRRAIWPLREVIGALDRGESQIIQSSTRIYLRDIYDHIIQVIDTAETLRDILSEMVDIYLSSVSNRMNQVMKVLTVISTVFMPLTFLAGVYGMNFDYMPELRWHWSYLVVWLVMIVIAVSMLAYFRKKKWW